MRSAGDGDCVSGENSTPPVTFGQVLRRYRHGCGLSQEELGERACVAVRTICDIERGRTVRPYRRTVVSLARALDLGDPQRDEFMRLSRQREEPLPLALADRTAPETAAGRPAAGVVPRQLPAAVRHFTGRAAELDALTGMLSQDGGLGTLVISALAGTAGVGKTALAVQWAHQVAERFPDGQLYVNLRGYDPHQPVSPADALAGFLQTLGVPGQGIPDGEDERTRLYRSRLAGRRMLVLVDNARDGAQVRPLLPGDPGCVAVVTSRDMLAGLVATDGARRLDLDLLPLDDAIVLLRSLIGPRADEDPEAATELARLCARLPLALRITAELAAARPQAPLAELAAELAAGRLEGLDAGEDRADVRTVFSWSVRQLTEEVATAFALVGLHPGENLDAYACAALTGTGIGQARKVLGRMYRASLLQAAGPGRYGMHDLLRAYAREQAAARDTEGQGQQALTRLFDYYLTAAAAAMDVLFPAEAYLRPRVPPSGAAVPDMAGEADARAWLDAERTNLVNVVVHCAGHGWPRHATRLARTLFRYLETGSHWPAARAIHGHALQAARQTGDVTAEASALRSLGGIAAMTSGWRDAGGNLQAALELSRQCGDHAGEAQALRSLGNTEYTQDRWRPAADYYRQAIAAWEEAGDRLGVARGLAALAAPEVELGWFELAAEHLRAALPVLRAASDRAEEAGALARIGKLHLYRGELTQAASFIEDSLAIFRRVGRPAGVGASLISLGIVGLRQADYEQAACRLRQAIAVHREIGAKAGEMHALRLLAEILRETGQPAAARAELEIALTIADETGHAYEQAHGHRDLAESYHRAGDDEQARQHWRQALDLYTQLGASEAAQVRSRLAANGGNAGLLVHQDGDEERGGVKEEVGEDRPI
jgi:tetratricopeptide (TPR) repeat protein/transcriptional regulator with XRE-family HTH domain